MCVNSLNSQFICVNVRRPVWNVCLSRGSQPVAMEAVWVEVCWSGSPLCAHACVSVRAFAYVCVCVCVSYEKKGTASDYRRYGLWLLCSV